MQHELDKQKEKQEMNTTQKTDGTQYLINKVINLLDLDLAKEIIEEMFDYLTEKEAKTYVRDVLETEFEVVSDCCAAPLVVGIESERCSSCGEFCGTDYL